MRTIILGIEKKEKKRSLSVRTCVPVCLCACVCVCVCVFFFNAGVALDFSPGGQVGVELASQAARGLKVLAGTTNHFKH